MNKKSSGCIYTRRWVVNLMLDICNYNKENDLTTLAVIEPACGDGSFATEIVERLCESARIHGKGVNDMKKAFRAYEIDSAALNEAEKKVRLILLKKGYNYEEAISLIDSWFQHSNFILDANENADLVIGNPPYIRATNLSKTTRECYKNELESFTQGTDLYIAFMEKGVKLLNKNGKLCVICSDRWQKNQYGTKFRDFLMRNNYHVSFNCQMHDVDVFEKEVTAYPSITVIEQEVGFEKNITCDELFDETSAKVLLSNLYKKDKIHAKHYRVHSVESNINYDDLTTLEDSGVKLGIGIATGRDKVFVTDDFECVESSRLLPLAYARDIKNYSFNDSQKWMINPWEDGELVDLSSYPKLKKYLENNKEELSKRYIAKRNPKAWYRTIDKIKYDLIGREKLLLRDLSLSPEPIYEKGDLYPHHNLYWIMSDVWDVKVLGGILISDTIRDMMKEISIKMHGGVIRNQVQYLRKLRVPAFSSISNDVRSELVIAFKNRDKERASDITRELYRRRI